jgi:replicative DNA helicase
MPDGDVSPLFGIPQRVPPSNLRAEQAFLGALLANNKVADRAQFLEADHFADPINGVVFKRAMQRIAAGQLADMLTLKTDFENTGILEEVGGTAYLVSLGSAMVGTNIAGEYAKTIRDTWLRRKLIDIAEDIAGAAFGESPDQDAQSLVDRAAESVLSLGESAAANRGTDFATVAPTAPGRAQAAHRGDAGHARLDTGIAPVDRLWRGLWPGQLYYLMARSRTGKTPAMMQIARHVAGRLLAEPATPGRAGSHVHIFSLEMTAEDLITTNLASRTRWTADQIKAGEIGGPKDWIEFEAAAAELAKLPIIIDDQPNMDLPTLVMRARAVKRQKNTRLICIDFRELVRRGREQARMDLPEWIPYLGYALKGIAKACEVPVIALAQINKTKSGAAPVAPTLDDLPYDGGQAADGVFALHRPEIYMPEEPPPLPHGTTAEKQANRAIEWKAQRDAMRGVAEFYALKRRFGPPGSTKLYFDGPRMLLSEWTGGDPPPGLWGENDPDWRG